MTGLSDLRSLASALTITFIAAAALAVAPSADAASQSIGAFPNVNATAVNGDAVYVASGRKVLKISASTGARQVIHTAPRNWQIADLRADGGRLGIGELVRTKAKNMSRVLAYDAATGAITNLGTGKLGTKRKTRECGSVVALSSVSASGEVIAVKTTAFLSRKNCRRSLRLTASVIGASALGRRTLYSADANRDESLAKLGVILLATLNGDKLVLSGFGGVGVLDVPTQKFSMVESLGRSTFSVGMTDRAGNILLGKLSVKSLNVTYLMLEGASGYLTERTLETTSALVDYAPCGDYLMRAQLPNRNGRGASIKLVANPFIAAPAPYAADLLGSNELLVDAACDATNVIYGVYVNGKIDVYLAPLLG